MLHPLLPLILLLSPLATGADVPIDTLAIAGGQPAQAAAIAASMANAMASASGETVIFLTGDEDRPAVVRLRPLGKDDEEVKRAEEIYKSALSEPRVWIGVRISPLPKPLAAHVGEQGIMIANVVKDSPADQAGLEQYDVVLRFAGREVNRPEDLTAAVSESEAGRAVTVEIIRNGQSRKIQITPVTRPKGAGGELKYEEPEAAENTIMRWHGKGLLRDPNGNWLFRDLGPLHSLPDVLKELEDLDVRVNVQPNPHWLNPDVDVRVFRHGEAGPDGDGKRQVKISLRVDEDGKQISINQDENGKIEVTHRDANGEETGATYDSADALRDADPEAYEIYAGHIGGRGHMKFHFQPFNKDDLKRWRKDFQVEIEKSVRDAVESMKDAHGGKTEWKWEKRLDDNEDGASKQRVEEKTRIERQGGGKAAGAGQARQPALMVHTDDSGAITVIETRGGQRQVRKYPSQAALESADPELYERVKPLLDAAPE